MNQHVDHNTGGTAHTHPSPCARGHDASITPWKSSFGEYALPVIHSLWKMCPMEERWIQAHVAMISIIHLNVLEQIGSTNHLTILEE